MPRPILKSLSSARFISSINLTAGYWQIPLREEDRDYNGFMLGTKVYRFKVLPFGITTAVASFTRAMSLILGEGFETFVLPDLDDLLIYSETFEEHILHLDQVFSRLAEAGMTLKFSKCNFIPEK